MITSVTYVAPVFSNDPPRDLVSQLPFWEEWDGTLTGNSGMSLFINLMIIAFGISISQSKNKYTGWFPIVVLLAYSGGNALVRSSGWRFALPADWVILVYYSIALAYLPSRIMLSSNENTAILSDIDKVPNRKNNYVEIITFCALLLLGASVPLAEKLIPARDFSSFTNDARELLSQSDLESFMKQDNAVFYSGVALYPRYIKPNSRIYLADAPPRDYKYLHFWLINDDDNQIVFPTESSPAVFPHTGTVSVIGCKEDNYILAWAVILHTHPSQIYVQDSESSIKLSIG